eukprot:1096863-Amphidinium_carterae.2
MQTPQRQALTAENHITESCTRGDRDSIRIVVTATSVHQVLNVELLLTAAKLQDKLELDCRDW